MGRKVIERNLSTREARKALPVRSEPYWRNEGEGQHIGYYHGELITRWVARYRIPGRLKGYTKTTLGEADDKVGRVADGVRVLDWKQAKTLAMKWFAEMDAADGIKLGAYTVTDALNDYIIGFRGKDVENTKRRIEKLIRPELGHLEVSKLRHEQISKWHRDRAATPARLRSGKKAKKQNAKQLMTAEDKRKRKCTANRDLSVLKAVLNVAYRDGKIMFDNAWRRVKPFPNVERARLRYLSDDEARRMVNACPLEFRPMVQAALLTGARYQELAGATVGNLDITAGTLMLMETKANRPRVCYLEAEGLGLFQEAATGKSSGDLLFPRPDGTRWGNAQQGRPIAKACEIAKIEPSASFHDLRRTFGARLAIKGVPMAVIAEALGHADERITRRHYAHLAPSYVAEQIRENIAGLGIFQPSKNVIPIQ